MPPEYRRPPNADTVYIYKDGPLMPDPELSGEEQLAQQAAYIASFASFDDDDDLQIEAGENGEDDFGSDDDMFDENGEMRGMTDDEIEPYEPVPEKPNEIMATLLREEKRGVSWIAISDDLDRTLSQKYNSDFRAASRLDIGYHLKETEDIDPNNYKDSTPSLTEFDFPRYWNWTMGILAEEDSNPKPGLYPLQGDWKIIYRDRTTEYSADAETLRTAINLPLMFELHNEDLQAILKKRELLPKEGLRDEDWNLLVLEPTAEDAQNLAEILLMDSMTGGWVATASLLSRIQEVYMTCGPPPKREIPAEGQPDLLVVEDDLYALVRLYHYYRDQAEPKLQAMRFANQRMPGKNDKKEMASVVERVIRMRNEVRAAKNVAVGIELKPEKDKTKKDKAARKRKTVPRNHPISFWFQDPYGTRADTKPLVHWQNQSTTGQSKITDWTSPDAKDRYTDASVERAKGQLNVSKYTADGGLASQDAFEDWCQTMQSESSPTEDGAKGAERSRKIAYFHQIAEQSSDVQYSADGKLKRQDGLEEWGKSMQNDDSEKLERPLGIQVNDLEM